MDPWDAESLAEVSLLGFVVTATKHVENGVKEREILQESIKINMIESKRVEY